MNRTRAYGMAALRLAVAALASVWLISSCGGGVGTGGTGSFAAGPITGFGSIVVDGVHFDETRARVEDEDGAARDRNDLRLGTVVEVESGEISNAAAEASRVRIVSELVGVVDATSGGALVVNGQSVRVNAGTVFDAAFSGGLAGVGVGRVVEVYGFVVGSSGDLLATRVQPSDGATVFKFRGVIAALDTMARTFRIGGQGFSYPAQLAGVAELRNGAFVRVLVALARDAQGRWPVIGVDSGVPKAGEHAEVRARGVITSFASNAAFQVGGWSVDAASARIDDGPLAAGQRVEIEGRMRSGVLVASRVKVEDEAGDGEFELGGRIATIDDMAQTFLLDGRRERVSYARSDIMFENGTVASLTVSSKVKVFGRLSADGTQVEATRIRIED